MERRSSLWRRRSVCASSSAVRAATRSSSSAVQRLELAGLAVEIDEHPHLGAQHLGHHRHRDVVDGADLVAAQMVGLADLDGRDEDDGELLEARMLADHGGELEAVELRHHHVDQHDGARRRS